MTMTEDVQQEASELVASLPGIAVDCRLLLRLRSPQGLHDVDLPVFGLLRRCDALLEDRSLCQPAERGCMLETQRCYFLAKDGVMNVDWTRL